MMARARNATVFPLGLLALLIAGCSLDYGSSQLAEERPEDIPESVIQDASFTTVRTGERTFTVTAAQAESYPEKSLRRFREVSFREYDAEGKLLTEGTAGTATYFTDNDNVELSDDVYFFSTVHDAGISAPYLYWDDEERLLEAKDSDLIRVERDSGTTIQGRGFEADMKRAVVQFTNGVEGTVVTDEDEE
jgi:LPS export ABC transporter protein LptC